MISPAIAIHDLDPTGWRNLQRLLLPPSRSGRTPRVAPPLVLFIEEGRCVKALRPGGAPVRADDFPWAGPWSLGRHRRAVKAPFALAVVDDALDRVFADLEANVGLRDDLVAQALACARAARAELGRGLHLDPDPLARIPVPSFGALQTTLDTLLPDGRSAALFVFDGADVWTSAVVEKQGGDLVRLTSHLALGVARPAFRGGAHRDLLAALEQRVARPHVAAFFTLDAWRDVVGDTPGALARAVAAGHAVIDPAPPWLLALTGLGAVAGVAQEAARLLSRFVPRSIKDGARAMSPFASLGFDPIQLAQELRKLLTGRE